MATRINIEGLGVVSVDDSFLKLSPEEQARTVDEIKAQASQSQTKTSNPFVGAVEAAKRSVGGIADFALGIGDELDANQSALREKGWLGGKGADDSKPLDPIESAIKNTLTDWSKLNDGANQRYEPSLTWDEMKSDATNFVNPAKLAQFGGERAITSVPSMLEAVFSPGTFMMGQTGNIGQDRANNNGRAQPTTGDMAKALPAAVLSQVLEKLGATKLFSGSAVRGVGAEMLTEGGQSLAEYTGGTAGTDKGFSAGAAVDTTLEGAFSGLTAGTAQRGSLDLATKAVPAAATAVRDFGYNRQVSRQSPEQTASDLRVGKLFDAMKASQKKADTGTAQADDVTFKKVQDRISADIRQSVKQLYEADQIDKNTHDRLLTRKDSILKQADQHNRDLSQDDLDIVQSLPLEAPVKDGLLNAFRDLNTITNAAMKKNARGPLERAARTVLPLVATGAGVSNPVAGIATLAAKGSVISGARGLDNLLGLQQPEILRRIRVAQRRNKGAAVGDTAHFLSDLSANAQAGVNVQNEAAAAETRSQRLMRAKRRMADNPGLAGFDRYIYDQTGLLPSEVDKGLLKLVQDGTITAEQQKAFYQAPKALKEGNQGNVIMDMLNDMAVKGGLKRNDGWQGLRPEALPNAQQGGTEGIRNIYAYKQAMSNVADATSTAQQSAPSAEMRQAVNDIASAPTPQAKAALFEQVKAANPQHAQWLDQVVAPITKFGPKDAAPTEATAPAAPSVGGGLGIRPSPIGTIPGAPGRLGAALAPEFRPAGGARVEQADLKPGKRLPVSDVAREEARVYKAKRKLATPELTESLEPDRGYLETVGDFLETAKHSPDDPEVKKSYGALIKETLAQFKAIGKDLKVTPFKGEGEPYRNSREAMQDIVRNRHLYYFRTESGFGEGADTTAHPMLEGTGIKDADGNELLANDVFRIVHDYFGHSQNGFQFGPKGEYNAFQEHARMFTPAAVPALAAETLAQNAWVNYGPHMRSAEAQAKPQKERRFADQKAFIVPWSVLAKDPNAQSIANVLGLAPQVDPKGDRISTRKPATLGALEDPTASDLQVDIAAMKRSPEAFAHNTELLKSYPGFKTEAKTPEGVAKDFVAHVKSNLLWLFDQVPQETRDRSRLWYDGAYKIAGQLAEKHGVPRRAAAAVLAALSPQKDWYQNVSLAERVLDIHNTMTKGNMVAFTPDAAMKSAVPEAFAKYPDMLKTVLSKPYAEMPDADHKAMWLRIYDEAHNPRTYNIILPEGDKGPEASSRVAWGSLTEIGKALEALSNPARENISELMGEKHKVRNFYNNIADPNSDRGDVTIDTHAVAAGQLRPLAGSHAEVHHNFGSSPLKEKQPKGWVPAKKAGAAGAVGTYGLYADAYREAAAERGVLPREMQSITWEAIRGLFTPTFKKNKKAIKEIDDIWRKYQTGELSLDETRDQIKQRAGGIDEPTWKTGRDTGPDEDL